MNQQAPARGRHFPTHPHPNTQRLRAALAIWLFVLASGCVLQERGPVAVFPGTPPTVVQLPANDWQAADRARMEGAEIVEVDGTAAGGPAWASGAGAAWDTYVNTGNVVAAILAGVGGILGVGGVARARKAGAVAQQAGAVARVLSNGIEAMKSVAAEPGEREALKKALVGTVKAQPLALQTAIYALNEALHGGKKETA